MALKSYRPTSPGRRSMSGATFEEITKDKPEKSLLLPLKKRAGRNNQGRMTVRHRGGGAKRRLRIIDFRRDKFDVPGKVASIEYDPNRSANIALIFYADGEKRYILAPTGLSVGDTIKAGNNAAINKSFSFFILFLVSFIKFKLHTKKRIIVILCAAKPARCRRVSPLRNIGEMIDQRQRSLPDRQAGFIPSRFLSGLHSG